MFLLLKDFLRINWVVGLNWTPFVGPRDVGFKV